MYQLTGNDKLDLHNHEVRIHDLEKKVKANTTHRVVSALFDLVMVVIALLVGVLSADPNGKTISIAIGFAILLHGLATALSAWALGVNK